MSRKRQEAELRTRIAKHLSGRVRPPGATTLTSTVSTFRYGISGNRLVFLIGIIIFVDGPVSGDTHDNDTKTLT